MAAVEPGIALYDVASPGGTKWCATEKAVQGVGEAVEAWEAVLDRSERPLARAAERQGRPVRLPWPSGDLAVLVVAVEAPDGSSEIVNLVASWAEVDRNGLRRRST